MKRILVIGARGQLGSDVCDAYDGADVELHRANSDDLDIFDNDAVQRYIGDLKPNIVINTAAFHNVPKCEEEPANAFIGNAMSAKYLAVACREAGARLVHVSTDYVFGMGGTRPYVETDLPAPLSVYGATKLAGEHLIAAELDDYQIVRTAAIYGTRPCRAKGGKNFVDLMLHLAAERGEVKVVTDEITTPSYTGFIGKQIALMAEKAEPGLYHVTCQGECAWYDFAKAIFDETGTEVTLHKTTTAEFPSPVKRPNYSVLENKHLADQGLDIMPDWQTGLKQYLADKKTKV